MISHEKTMKKYAGKLCIVQNFVYLCSAFEKMLVTKEVWVSG